MNNQNLGNTFSVRVENLTKTFGDFTAVDNINFEVKKGEIFGFLGPNGAGKSTTIKILCGLLKPTSGSAIVGGYDVAKDAYQIKNNIGYMSQKFSLYDDLTVDENLNFFGGIYNLTDDQLAIQKKWILRMADLEDRQKNNTRDLAVGWKQRLALGCAILHKPEIIFLDEPTAGVDPVSRRKFWNLIYNLAEEGITVFVTTHYLDEAEYCNRIGLIFNGKIKAIGSPPDLKENLKQYSIYEVYCDRVFEAMEILTEEPWVKETSIYGTSFHVSTLSDTMRENIIEFLSGKGFQVERVEKIIPSLEDVFIHLMEENEI